MAANDRPAGMGGGTRLNYMPALDGVRAVAMAAIMAFHGGFGWAQGTFLSVDAFFVLSGFLITSLLIKEWRRSGSINLRAFWVGRARRLLPGLFVMLAGIALYAAVIAPPDTRAGLRLDALSTVFYVANWHQILAGQSYFFQQSLPSPVLHTWTLAIEEQFYLVWPLVVIGVLGWRTGGIRRLRRTQTVGSTGTGSVKGQGRGPLLVLLAVTVILIIGSALDMALLFHPGTTNDRVYYGTDTRAQSLLIGAVLAVFSVVRGPLGGRAGRTICQLSALAGAAFTAWTWTAVASTDAWLYRGGWALVGVGVAAVLLGVVEVPTSLLAKALSLRPLRYLGRISYGTYLWYWPVFLVVDGARTGLRGYALFGLRAGITYLFAAASYHFVEMPVRRGLLRDLRLRLGDRGPRRLFDIRWQPALLVVVALFATTSSGGSAAAAGLAAGKSAVAPPVQDSATGMVRVEVFGDSVAWTLAFGMARLAPAYGARIWDEAVVGCGLATGGPVNDRGQITEQYPGGALGEKISPGQTCDNWPEQWPKDLAQHNPQVAVLLAGRWETLDRFHDGRWEHIGEPDFDRFLLSELEEAVSVLHSRGAQVVFLTSPYDYSGEAPGGGLWPQEQPVRMDVWNEILAQVAAGHPGVVTFIPLGAWLSPGGHYSAKVDGVTVRSSDGIHLTEAGDKWLAPRLIPELVAIGHSVSR